MMKQMKFCFLSTLHAMEFDENEAEVKELWQGCKGLASQGVYSK